MDTSQKVNSNCQHIDDYGMLNTMTLIFSLYLFFFNQFSVSQPNIHPGCISSTGRNCRTGSVPISSIPNVASSISGSLSSVSLGSLNLVGHLSNNILMAATSTQNAAAQQLIGGAISPALFVTSSHTESNVHPQLNISGNQHLVQQQTSGSPLHVFNVN